MIGCERVALDENTGRGVVKKRAAAKEALKVKKAVRGKTNQQSKIERRRKMKKLIRLFKDEEGATAVEYGLMVAGIAVAIAVVVFTLGKDISTLFETVSTCISTGVCT